MSHFEDIDATITGFGDLLQFDAFGRFRVSQVTTLYDQKQLHDSLPLFVDIQTNGTGSDSHSTTNAATTVTTSASGDWVKAQTKQRFNYQSGKSQLLFWTFNGFDNETNITKRVGYFSSSSVSPYTASLDGFFIQSDGTNISLNVYRSGTLVASANRSAWDDPADGSGTCPTHDFDNNTILGAQFQWLGVGRILFFIEKGGLPYKIHEFDFTDSVDVYMSSPNQPMRWEIIQSGAGSGSFDYVCSSANSEGSLNQIGKDGGIGDDGTHLDANSTSSWYVAIGLRLKSTHLDSIVDVLNAVLKSDTNDGFAYRVCINPTYAGTLTWTNVTNYGVQYALGATANTVSAFGSTLKAGLGTQQSVTELDLSSAIRIGSNLDGTPDEIILMVKPHSVNLDVHRVMNWRELA